MTAADRPSVTDDARAETTTTTVEDAIEDLAVELFERSHEPSFTDDRRGMDEAREWARRIAAGLLATACTRPTRDELARTLKARFDADADGWLDMADAVLALLTGGAR